MLKSKALVMAAGGRDPHLYTGSAGEGYRWLRGLGHAVTRLVPSPIECGGDGLSKLSQVQEFVRKRSYLRMAVMEKFNSQFGLSGICVFNLSD